MARDRRPGVNATATDDVEESLAQRTAKRPERIAAHCVELDLEDDPTAGSDDAPQLAEESIDAANPIGGVAIDALTLARTV